MKQEFQKTKLKNGLTIITCPLPHLLSVGIHLLVKAGSRYENKTNQGLAHFLEHLAFKGSKKYPHQKIIAETIEKLGGYINAFTAKEIIDYYLHLPAENFASGLDVLADIVQNPLLEPKEIAKERGTVLEELNHYHDLPDISAYQLLLKIAYPQHPLGFPSVGQKSTLKKLQRSNFQDYLSRYFIPSRMVIAIAGKGQREKWLKEIEKRFAHLKDQKGAEFLLDQDEQKKPRLALEYRPTDQTHLVLGFKSPLLAKNSLPKNKILILALDTLLAASFSSRLFLKIRDELGLAYALRSEVASFQENGLWILYIGLNKEKVSLGLKAIIEELRRLKQELVNQEELKKVQEFIKGRLILQNEVSSQVAYYYGEQAALDPQIITRQQAIALIKAIKPWEIQKLAQQLFKPSQANLALVGPNRNKGTLEKILFSLDEKLNLS